ncbi:DUF3833 domain-containing protein [Photobacterium sp. MCCC 1A19761]|uniref:DUF3833 domain-containing protein n=1 Tax=Photobacterium sp. MCCC 1A19761 TaxID=3115000 RepID=UPI00307D8E64
MRWKAFKIGVLVIGLFGLPGCSSTIEDYRGTSPEFQLFEYFDGQVKAWGMLQDWQGKLTRRFEVDIRGVVAGNQLTLDEDFLFDNGEKQQRTWVIHRGLDKGHYVGRAGDVIGQAKGRSIGNALRWQYVLRVPVGETTFDISLDDWMFRQDSKRVFNRATMKKWGVTVGTITLFFEKQ